MRILYFVIIYLMGTDKLLCQVINEAKKYTVVAIGFWNVENLYDTLNDPNKEDDEFLPEGLNAWTGDRYKTKIEHLSSVISEMALDATPDGLSVVGLCEIENKNVLKDLVNSTKLKLRNYQVVHFEGPDARGIDPALLYNPDYFRITNKLRYKVTLPNTTHKTRDELVVSGLLCGEPFTFIVNHWPSRRGGESLTKENRIAAALVLKHITDSITNSDPKNKIVVMGDFNDNPTDASIKKYVKTYRKTDRLNMHEFFNPMENLFKNGIGTIAWADAWNLFDQMFLNKPLVVSDNKTAYKDLQYYKVFVFNRSYLINDQGNFKGYPFRTYSAGIYTGGYSDHFPIYTLLIRELN